MISAEPLVRSEDKTEVALLKIVSLRMKEGRELTGLPQYQAAQLIGVPVDSLKAWEDGFNDYSIPLQVIVNVAKTYDISIDWLFGLVEDDWEVCPEVRRERDFSVSLQTLILQEQAKVAVKLVEQDSRIFVLLAVPLGRALHQRKP